MKTYAAANCSDIAVILAGGKGTRFKGKKQFAKLRGKALWRHVYDTVTNLLPKENIVVVGVDVEGGETRSQSVINGLKYFEGKGLDYAKVLIVESARPLVTPKQLQILLTQTRESATFISPLVNTIIGCDGTYYNREEFYELLTPQCFDFKKLCCAYATKKEWDMTDETRVMYEVYAIKPEMIKTGENLVKVTYQRDLPFIENLLHQQEEDI